MKSQYNLQLIYSKPWISYGINVKKRLPVGLDKHEDPPSFFPFLVSFPICILYFDSNELIGCTWTEIIEMTRYSFGLWSIIRLCRKDDRVVEGVALELLCKLLFTEGSNPSLSVYVLSSIEFANLTDHNLSNEIPIKTILLIHSKIFT